MSPDPRAERERLPLLRAPDVRARARAHARARSSDDFPEEDDAERPRRLSAAAGALAFVRSADLGARARAPEAK